MAVFGDFTGGELKVWPDDTRQLTPDRLPDHQATSIDVRHKLLLFDGTKAHQALPAQGTRFSVLWYTTAGWKRMTREAHTTLQRLRFVPPQDQDHYTAAVIQRAIRCHRG
eukprot:7623934-Prorocentrum_lima.AAC.1